MAVKVTQIKIFSCGMSTELEYAINTFLNSTELYSEIVSISYWCWNTGGAMGAVVKHFGSVLYRKP